jgi:hypothetical protein
MARLKMDVAGHGAVIDALLTRNYAEARSTSGCGELRAFWLSE